MSLLKKIAAAAAACCLSVALLASCHAEDEAVLDIAGTKINSSLYLSALMTADLEFQQNVQSSTYTSTASTDYKTMSYEDKSYEVWVTDRALENLKTYVYIKDRLSEAEVSLSADTQSQISYVVNYYWSYYQYQEVCELNGISKDDFEASVAQGYMSDELFNYYYGEGGEREISKDETLKALSENYILADVISEDISSSTEDDISSTKATLNAYKDRLAAGESFETIYNEYNGIDTSSSSETSSTDEAAPVDKYANIYGGEETSSPADEYADLAKTEIGVPTVLELDDTLMLVLRKDITEDSYYYDNYGISARYLLKGEEFENEIDTQSAALEVTELKNLDYYTPQKLSYS